MHKKQLALFGLLVLLVVAACSTEKNTLLSRTYHGTTAHYNGYFNANDLLSQAMGTYRGTLKEDFYKPLTIRPLPDEEAVKAMYSPIDTAIAKCTKVIQRHAMPGMDKPSKKKEEHNKWIDENWTTIGIANYYRRDYDLALKNFEYVKKFFSDDPSAYVAELWMAKTYIQQEQFTEANFSLTALDKAVEASEGSSKASKSKSKSKSKAKKKSAKDEKGPAEFPKKLRFELEITRAQFAEAKEDPENEIKALEASLEFAKKSADKARVHFILGQLYEAKGDRALATEHYEKALKYNGGYEMSFNARLKRALNGGGDKVKQDLMKMLRDEKNTEFKDQIYYTLGLIAQQEGNDQQAIERYTNAAFYSTSNARQKGMAYERMGDMSFRKKDYVKAQKYYDSCATIIPENYPNAEGVRNKARRLQDLVVAIEMAHYEDSVQRISTMSEDDRYAFAEKLVKQMKEDEARRKRLDAARAQQLQDMASKSETGSGNKWYWNNTKARQEGFEEFKRQWGSRENEDDWRRSEKIVFASFTDPDADTLPEVADEVVIDSLTPESLLAKLPLTDSLLQGSRERMMSAYFDAGRIYQDQLNEKSLAEQQYVTIIDKPFESNYKLLSSYQIYKMYDPGDGKAMAQKDYILTNYPTSDFAGYLRDPDYFIRKKEREKVAEQEYLTDLDRFERGLYYPVLLKANQVITAQKENQFRAKYYLLKAMAQAKLNEDKTTLLPTLDSLILEYPGTVEAKKGADMRKIITEGYSTNLAVDFNKKSLYKYEENVPYQVLIFPDKTITSNVGKTRVAEFNKEFFGRSKLGTSSKVFGEKSDQSVIIVKDFQTENEAAEYVSSFKKTKKHLLEMNKSKIVYISLENMKVLFETQKLPEYEVFFDEYY